MQCQKTPRCSKEGLATGEPASALLGRTEGNEPSPTLGLLWNPAAAPFRRLLRLGKAGSSLTNTVAVLPEVHRQTFYSGQTGALKLLLDWCRYQKDTQILKGTRTMRESKTGNIKMRLVPYKELSIWRYSLKIDAAFNQIQYLDNSKFEIQLQY